MKKFIVHYPFEGSLTCEVFAENEEDAAAMAETIFDAMPVESVIESAQFGHLDIYEE